MVWTVLAHLDDLALDEERAARHALDDAQVDDEDVARDDPAVEGIVLHDGRERMVFAERNADSAARSYELEGPVLRVTSPPPDRGIERKGGVRAALEPLLEGKDLDETVGEKAGGAGDRVDDAVGETGDLVLERAPDPEAELEASAFGLRDGKTRLDAVGIDQTVEEPERVAQREKRRRKTVRAEGSSETDGPVNSTTRTAWLSCIPQLQNET